MADAIVAGRIYGRIYCVTNLVNGKQYVGMTVRTVAVRWRAHCDKKEGFCLHDAIAKYGKGNFTVAEIEAAASAEELQIKEREWIARLGTIAPSGYNLLDGGGNGWEVHDSTRAKISVAGKRVWADPIYRSSMQNKRKEAAANPEWRLKMSAVSKAALSSPEVRARMSIASKERCNTPEAKARASVAAKAFWRDPATREKIMTAHKAALARPEVKLRREAGRTLEWRQRLSMALAGRVRKPHSAETKRKISLAQIGKSKPHGPHSEETKQKMREAALRRAKPTMERRRLMSEAGKRRFEDPAQRERQRIALVGAKRKPNGQLIGKMLHAA